MATETNTLHLDCDFCGKSRADVVKLIVANEAAICNECIELCAKILDVERVENIKSDKKMHKVLDPVKIKQHLDKFIVGQEQAKIQLCVAVVNHYKRVYFFPAVELEKSNLLMYGPSGCGKTMLIKTIAKYLNVPFVTVDATTLTQAGYVGEDVENMLGRLLSAADNDVERCEKGIVFIDEIDKISRKNESASLVRDVGGEGVQQALLKIVEGTKCRVTVSGNKKHAMSDTVEIDTNNILFIAGGAFIGLDKIVNQRTSSSSIGFTTQSTAPGQPYLLPTDFVKYGMIPEFVGRFPIAIKLLPLTLDDLTNILCHTKNNQLDQIKFYFASDNIELIFTDDAVASIAQQAMDLGLGARGLKTVLEATMTHHMYHMQAIKAKQQKELCVDSSMIITSIEHQTNTQGNNEIQSHKNRRTQG